MNEMILEDVNGNKTKATFLFTHFDYNFGKNYIVYLVDNDLSSGEYDMIDKVIESKMGEESE